VSHPVKRAKETGWVFLRICVQKVARLPKLIWTGISSVLMERRGQVLKLESPELTEYRQVLIRNPRDYQVEILTAA
jgi:hypothetical protein